MRILRGIVISSAFAVLIMTLVPAAKADQGDWSTLVSFTEPAQIGSLVLSPGTYVLRIADIWAPDFVMIYNADTRHCVGIVKGTPAYRTEASEKTTFINKNVNGGPEELKYWYYPDLHIGVKFFTPKGQPSTAVAAFTKKR